MPSTTPNSIPRNTPRPSTQTTEISLECSYRRLPQHFYVRQQAARFPQPRLVWANHPLAQQLQLTQIFTQEKTAAEFCSGQKLLAGSEPIALAYAGHQFGHFTILGDGRALLLGDRIVDGQRFDIQLKGSGTTPFSRRGDGRAALGPVLRECLISEAMHALGIPTTRSLAAVTTGESVRRETRLAGAVLTRVAGSHVRVGTFEWLAATNDAHGIQQLADYCIERHYPTAATERQPYTQFFNQLCARHGRLIAQWLLHSFIHGVMNTDNCSIAGETLDYGPCAFLDEYQPDLHFSAIDSYGRYAYDQQAAIGAWNLQRLAECLRSLFEQEQADLYTTVDNAMIHYTEALQSTYSEGLRGKLGLMKSDPADDELMQDWMICLQQERHDFTNAFLLLSNPLVLAHHEQNQAAAPNVQAFHQQQFEQLTPLQTQWLARWRSRQARQQLVPQDFLPQLQAHNPRYRPRNHLVEAALNAAEDQDFTIFSELMAVISAPFEEHPQHIDWRQPPRDDQRVMQTFCGT